MTLSTTLYKLTLTAFFIVPLYLTPADSSAPIEILPSSPFTNDHAYRACFIPPSDLATDHPTPPLEETKAVVLFITLPERAKTNDRYVFIKEVVYNNKVRDMVFTFTKFPTRQPASKHTYTLFDPIHFWNIAHGLHTNSTYAFNTKGELCDDTPPQEEERFPGVGRRLSGKETEEAREEAREEITFPGVSEESHRKIIAMQEALNRLINGSLFRDPTSSKPVFRFPRVSWSLCVRGDKFLAEDKSE